MIHTRGKVGISSLNDDQDECFKRYPMKVILLECVTCKCTQLVNEYSFKIIGQTSNSP